MKKLNLLSVLLVLSLTSFAQTKNVTFRVDMNQQTVNPNGVWVGYQSQSISTNASQMTLVGNGIYSFTLQNVVVGDSLSYVFINGNPLGGGQQENVPQSCQFSSNLQRGFITTNIDTTLPAFCFSSCNVCPFTCTTITANVNTQGVKCAGNNDGEAQITPTNGTPPYSYTWSNSLTSSFVNTLSEGNYTVTVTDSNNCTGVVSVTILSPFYTYSITNGSMPVLKISPASTTPALMDFGAMDGSWGTNLNLSNAQGQLVVARDSSAADSLLCNGPVVNAAQVAGKIALVYRGSCDFSQKAYACQQAGAIGVIVINNQPGILNLGGGTFGSLVTIPVILVTQTSGQLLRNLALTGDSVFFGNTTTQTTMPNCFGQNNGSAEILINGGTSPYTYLWSNNSTSRKITNLTAGTYDVTITDANNCINVNSVLITQPQQTSATISNFQSPSSGSSTDGSITVFVNSGAGPFTYAWNTTPTQTTATATNLGVGLYTVTITDANNCSISLNFNLTTSSTFLNATANVLQNVSCYNGNNGAATIQVSGGTPPYTYLWNTPQAHTTPIVNNLSEGIYTVIVKDTFNLADTVLVTISSPANPINISLSSTFPVLRITPQSSASNLMDFGFMAGSWGTDLYNSSAQGQLVVARDSSSADSLACNGPIVNAAQLAGNIAVVYRGGCEFSQKALACQQAGAIGVIIVNNQSGLFNIDGGSVGYLVSVPVMIISETNGQQLRNLMQTGLNVFMGNDTVQVQHPSCFGANDGSIQALVNGGTSPYTYFWQDSTTSNSISNLVAGNYSLTITDANNCITSMSRFLAQPPQINAVVSAFTAPSTSSSTDGSISITANGGFGNFSYAWSTNPVQTTATATNLSQGQYTVTITDSTNCSKVISFNLTTTSTSLSLSVSNVQHVLCSGNNTGSATIQVSGGTPPYNYNWLSLPTQTTATALNLFAGTYTLAVIDNNNLSDTISVEIKQPVNFMYATTQNPTPILKVMPSTSTSFLMDFGSMISSWGTYLNFTNAQGQLVVARDSSAADSLACNGPIVNAAQLTGKIAVVYRGGCEFGQKALACQQAGAIGVIIVNNQSDLINMDGASVGNLVTIPVMLITETNGQQLRNLMTTGIDVYMGNSSPQIVLPTCFGQNNGSAEVLVNGGVSPYTYLWSNNSTNRELSNVTSGNYTVTVTDANNCTLTSILNLGQLNPINTSISSYQYASSSISTDGSITVSATGGTPPYTYAWNTSPVQTTATATNLGIGMYTVTVTDSNACYSTQSFYMSYTGASFSVIVSNIQHPLCFGQQTGSATAQGINGIPPISYIWKPFPFQFNATATNLAAGNYTVIATDSVGNIDSTVITITQPDSLYSLVLKTDESCLNENDGSITVNAVGGTPPYSYSWSNMSNASSIYGLASGSYTVTVIDANVCNISYMETIQQGANVVLGILTGNFTPYQNDTITYSVNLDTNYTYNWIVTNGIITNGQGTNEIQVLWDQQGSGSVEVEISQLICTKYLSETITIIASVFEKSATHTELSIFPNPNTGNFVVNIKGVDNSNAELQIINSLGQQIYNLKLNDALDKQININENLSSGLYHLRLVSNETVYTKRFIVNQ